MKIIGLLGGMGPESTISYYKNIIDLYRNISNKDEYPNILINSINMTKMLNFVENKQFDELTKYLSEELNKLTLMGADICAICSNTPHIVFESLVDKVSKPILSIVEATADNASQKNLKKVLLIGTSFTMKNNFYSERFEDKGIKIIVPNSDEQDIINNIIFPELEAGIVLPEKKRQLIGICSAIIKNNDLDGIILGCTELPLMISGDDFDIEVLNTVDIHVTKLVHMALKQ